MSFAKTFLAAGALAMAIASGPVGAAPVREVVPAYIGDGLELAVIPTPQQAALTDEMIEIGPATVVMPPGDYGGPRTVETDLGAVLAPSKGKAPTRVLVGDAKRNPAGEQVVPQQDQAERRPGDGPQAHRHRGARISRGGRLLAAALIGRVDLRHLAPPGAAASCCS